MATEEIAEVATDIATELTSNKSLTTKALAAALISVGGFVVGRTLWRGMKAKKAQQTQVDPSPAVIETSATES